MPRQNLDFSQDDLKNADHVFSVPLKWTKLSRTHPTLRPLRRESAPDDHFSYSDLDGDNSAPNTCTAGAPSHFSSSSRAEDPGKTSRTLQHSFQMLMSFSVSFRSLTFRSGRSKARVPTPAPCGPPPLCAKGAPAGARGGPRRPRRTAVQHFRGGQRLPGPSPRFEDCPAVRGG